MELIRQRKFTGENGSTSERTYKNKGIKLQHRGTRKIQKLCMGLTGGVFIFTFVVGSYYNVLPWSVYSHATNSLDTLAMSLGFQKHSYAVIIDAGSTGSRVLAFTFHASLIDNSLKLDSELFVQAKPGLSSFSDNPKEGAEKLKYLLEKAKEVIPPSEWGVTPLAMKATAGLRLLPGDKAEALLEEVRTVFRESPFLTNENSVSIMDGVDEGLFSWFTVNFLLDRLGRDASYTVAAMDLGGGSTQITFAPSQEVTLKETDPKFLHQISAFHNNLSVYTHSYLGLGLMAARKEILSVGNAADSTVLNSECINPIINKEWIYNGVTYTVRGPKNPQYIHITQDEINEKQPVVRFEECIQIVRNYVSHKVDKPAELNTKKINAFSYYFDRATEYGLIDPFNGGIITVQNFNNAVKTTCGIPNTDQPFMCLDLMFICVLLQDGFGLSPETELNLFKQIDGHEISWALGAAFHILQNGL